MIKLLQKIVTAQIDARVIGLVRLGIGSAAVLRAIIGWDYLSAVLKPQNIPMPIFESLPRFPYAYVDVLGALWLAVSILFLVEFYTRITGFILTIIIGFIIGIDYQLYASHLYLLAILCFLLVLGNCGKAYSIDQLALPAKKNISDFWRSWHEVSLRYLVWGFCHGLGIVAWQQSKKIREKLPTVHSKSIHFILDTLSIILTLHFVWLGFILVRQSDIESMQSLLRTLFFNN